MSFKTTLFSSYITFVSVVTIFRCTKAKSNSETKIRINHKHLFTLISNRKLKQFEHLSHDYGFKNLSDLNFISIRLICITIVVELVSKPNLQ